MAEEEKIVILFDDCEVDDGGNCEAHQIFKEPEKSTGFQHLDEFEKKVQLMAKELDCEKSNFLKEKVKRDIEIENNFDVIKDELTEIGRAHV